LQPVIREGLPSNSTLTMATMIPEYGRRVAEGLQLDMAEVEKLAIMTAEERARATGMEL
jgi:hypothetical protein